MSQEIKELKEKLKRANLYDVLLCILVVGQLIFLAGYFYRR